MSVLNRKPRVTKSDKFQIRIANLSPMIISDAVGRAFNFIHQALKIIAGRRDSDDSNRRLIPQSGGFHFSNGNIEAGAQTVFQTAHNLSPVFQRLRSFNAEFEGEKGEQGNLVIGDLVIGDL